MVIFKNVPEAMQHERQWILWRSIVRGGKLTKVPWSVYDQPASSTAPETWHDWECAVIQYRPTYHAGLGFVFRENGGFAGIDLDGCRNPETGEIDEWAWVTIDRFKTYAEISPSGTGVKLFMRCSRSISKGINKKLDMPAKYGKTPGIEVYTHGRYFAVTGNVIRGYEDVNG